MTKEVEEAKGKFEKALEGEQTVDPVQLTELRRAKQEKSEEISEMEGGSSWWLPDTENIFEKGDNKNEINLKNSTSDQQKQQITFRGAVPIATVLNDHNQYKGDKYLLKYVNIDTGEIEFTPLRGNLNKQLLDKTALTKELLNRETNFNKDIQKKSSVLIKYWGAIYNKENDQSYHSYTVKSLR
jgi:hypothetical protein